MQDYRSSRVRVRLSTLSPISDTVYRANVLRMIVESDILIYTPGVFPGERRAVNINEVM